MSLRMWCCHGFVVNMLEVMKDCSIIYAGFILANVARFSNIIAPEFSRHFDGLGVFKLVVLCYLQFSSRTSYHVTKQFSSESCVVGACILAFIALILLIDVCM